MVAWLGVSESFLVPLWQTEDRFRITALLRNMAPGNNIYEESISNWKDWSEYSGPPVSVLLSSKHDTKNSQRTYNSWNTSGEMWPDQGLIEGFPQIHPGKEVLELTC